MKKSFRSLLITLSVISVIILASAIFSSCDEGNEVILNVYNWGEYISDGEDDSLNVNAEF